MAKKKSKTKKVNIASHHQNRFAKKFIELYETKGMYVAILSLYLKTKDKPARLNMYMEALMEEIKKRDDLDQAKFIKELISAIGINNGAGELSTRSSDEADNPQDEDERSSTTDDDSTDEGKQESDS